MGLVPAAALDAETADHIRLQGFDPSQQVVEHPCVSYQRRRDAEHRGAPVVWPNQELGVVFMSNSEYTDLGGFMIPLIKIMQEHQRVNNSQ